jgi:hypothetical protein
LRITKIDKYIDKNYLLQGKQLYATLSLKNFPLSNFNYGIFSQWNEDSIISYIINNVDIKNKTFVEFGVEDFSESNCRYLMFNDNWEGFVIDSSKLNIFLLKNSYYYWMYALNCECAFITKDNINSILLKRKFENIGILSIDIDGNDYFILEKIIHLNPDIIICEYNNNFTSLKPLSIPYLENFNRKNFSKIYYGANLSAFIYLMDKNNYSLVAINSAKSNAFFIKNSLLNSVINKLCVTNNLLLQKSVFSEVTKDRSLYNSNDNEINNIINNFLLVNVETNEVNILKNHNEQN